MELLGFAATLLMGTVLGLVGGGGAILTVPILVYLFQITPLVASGYSLFIVGLTAAVGSYSYIRKGDVHLPVLVAFAIPSVAGTLIARMLIVPSLPSVIIGWSSFTLSRDILVMGTFAVVMIAASFSMIKKRVSVKPASDIRIIPIALQGFSVGLLAGFVGAGGGFLIVPALVVLAGLGMRQAVGTSLSIIAIQSLFGFAGSLRVNAEVDWKLMISLAALAAVGIVLGARFSHLVKESTLKKSFGWFGLTMGVLILGEQLWRLNS